MIQRINQLFYESQVLGARNRVTKSYELIVVIFFLMLILIPQMMDIPVTADEYYWISKSAYLEEWFDFDKNAESWQLNNLTLSGPPLPKYIIALGRLAGGYNRIEVGQPSNYTFYYEDGILVGAIPNADLLFASRLPMAILAIVTGAIVYFLLIYRINRLVGILWLLLYILNKALISLLMVAMSEAPLLFFSSLSFVLFHAGLGKLRVFLNQTFDGAAIRPTSLLLGLSGMSLGLAAASKIHAFLLIASYGLLLLYFIFTTKSTVILKTKISYIIRLFSLISLTALVVFILFNPSIYANPIKGVGWMFQHRLTGMAYVTERYHQFSDLPLYQRWLKILGDLLTSGASIRGGAALYLNAALGLLGFSLVVRSLVTSIKRRLPLEILPSLLVYLSVLILAAFMSPLDWLRYFLFPIFGLSLLIAYGAAFLMERAWLLVKRLSQGVSQDTPVSPEGS